MSSFISALKLAHKFLVTIFQPMFLLEPDDNKEAMYIRHCAVSSIENGHKKVITDIHWLSDTFEVSLNGFMFSFCWIENVWKILSKEDVSSQQSIYIYTEITRKWAPNSCVTVTRPIPESKANVSTSMA